MRKAAFLYSFAALLCVVDTAGAANIVLKKVMFPNSLGGTSGPTTPPTAAPLAQAIVLEFSGAPQAPSSLDGAIRIVVDPLNTKGQTIGQSAKGEYEIAGNRIIWRPVLPKNPVPDGFGPQSDIFSSGGSPGLLPDTIYAIDLTFGTPNSIKNLKPGGLGLPVQFKTTAGQPGTLLVPSLYFNAPLKAPVFDKQKLKPKDGTTGLHPNLFNDPAGLFDSIPNSKKPPFKLKFNGPVDPSTDNLSNANLRIRAIRDEDGLPVDVTLASTSVLTSNVTNSAAVAVYPNSILPFGYTIVVELSDMFRALSGATKNDGSTPKKFQTVAKYKIANGPGGLQPINDFLLENFDNAKKQDTTVMVSEGTPIASWDQGNTDVLRASFGFAGDGSLGRFEPQDIDITIELDTNFQSFPLFSGATPDAAPGTVTGGVFNFTSFKLPPNVVLRVRGNNPLVITCTEECVIEGLIDLRGGEGVGDDTFDSAITLAPGGTSGPGGGRGGAGHPVSVDPGETLKFMMSPQFGQSGFAPGNTGPGGGGGGQSGCTLPWPGFVGDATCSNSGHAGDGSRGSGGGGGSFNVFLPNTGATQTGGIGPEPDGILVSGRRGAVGIGDHLPVDFDVNAAIPNEPAAYQAVLPGNPTNAVARPNPNPTFAEAVQQGMIYDNPAAPAAPNGSLNINSTWAKAKKVTLFGAAGPMVFTDSDEENNFIGPGGELTAIIGGQGGGGGGSRTEGISQICKQVIFTTLGLPFTVNDAKAGGGGGGGGAMLIQALDRIEFKGASAKVEAMGGQGAGGEEIATASRGGAGGGGAGGCVILQSAGQVLMNDPALPAVVINVSPGCGWDATTLATGATVGTLGGEAGTLQVADGGPGGPGLVQIHATDTSAVDVTRIKAEVNFSMFKMQCGVGTADGLDPTNVLVPFAKTPTPLTPRSVARSTWYDLGAVTSDFRPPIATSAGNLAGPIFGVPGVGPFFKGTNVESGLVNTDPFGNVLNPFSNDFEIDAPDVLKADFIPNGIQSHFQSVKIEFQGADEDPANAGLPDATSATEWVADATGINGKRFVRWQITFDIATEAPDIPPQPSTPLPQVNFLRIPFKY